MTEPNGLAAADFDATLSTALHDRLPGLRSAMDGSVVAAHLPQALGTRAPVESCVAGQASYLGDSCLVRYDVQVGGTRSVVTGRVFPDARTCEAYLTDRLQPLAEEAGNRSAYASFSRAVGTVPALHLALSVFPIDGELPTLVAATDAPRMLAMFQTLLPRTLDRDVEVTGCDVEAGHYGRAHRCVLRYQLKVTRDGRPAEPMLVYGKLAADDRGEPVMRAVDELRARAGTVVAIPRVLDYLPDLRLALFEALPGVPRVAQLLRARLGGVPEQDRRPPSLETALASCARTLSLLHTSGLDLGATRSFESDAAALRRSFALVRPVSPGLADRLDGWLEAAEQRPGAGPAPAVFAHGDYSYTQLIFDGNRAGLVDFDTVCMAEPGLDLGHFLAYLDMAGRKAGVPDQAVVTGLRDHFLASYLQASGLADGDELLDRTFGYETLSLLRLAAHSWAKLKPKRLLLVLAALDRRAAPSGGGRF